MPPKGRVPRKVSAASKDTLPATMSEGDAAKAMPPPPDPLVSSRILEPEINGLATCLKNAVVKTGQIYSFYADTRRLAIDKHVSAPPRSLTASLGREIEKYDQLCDSMESHLLRAISVLQRDLRREEKRIKDAETASIATRTRSKSMSLSPTSTRVHLPTVSDAAVLTEEPHQSIVDPVPTPTTSPPVPSASALSGRRSSAISISSLQRPAFPLKLDLSSTALRISPEEASLFSSGLASPVTLAPKSARPLGANEFPPDLMAAFASASSATDTSNRQVDIDLTVPDTDVEMSLDASAGNSAEKPIELDLDGMDIDMATMTDLFGDSADSGSNDANTAVDGILSPVIGGETNLQATHATARSSKEEEMFLDALGTENNDNNHDIFASLTTGATANPNSNPIDSSAMKTSPMAENQSVPSPGTLLAGFPSPSLGDASLNSTNLTAGDTPFDLNSLDLSHLDPGFFADAPESTMGFSMNMEDFLSISGGPEEKENLDSEVKPDSI